MLRFIVRRLLLTIPVLLGVATLVFSLIHLVPGDPVQAMLGDSATPQDVADVRARLGLDRPLPVQYGAFLSNVSRGNLGTSLRTNQQVASAIAERMPAPSNWPSRHGVCAAIALPPGIVAAVRAGTLRLARRSRWSAFIIRTWPGPLMAIVFSLHWDGCRCPGRSRGEYPFFRLSTGRALPAFRARACERYRGTERTLRPAARARGVSRLRAIVRHALSTA
jgi:ABC-type dipeptide/oligopeptide/nickel transport system permease component